jgi:hypothetical protein
MREDIGAEGGIVSGGLPKSLLAEAIPLSFLPNHGFNPSSRFVSH